MTGQCSSLMQEQPPIHRAAVPEPQNRVDSGRGYRGNIITDRDIISSRYSLVAGSHCGVPCLVALRVNAIHPQAAHLPRNISPRGCGTPDS